jgi:GNAT superfamily N-acetyltransferase
MLLLAELCLICWIEGGTMLIRAAIASDAEAIARLNAEHNDLRATPAQIATHIVQHAAFETPYVADRDGVVVGMACLRLLPCLCDPVPYAELTELLVAAAYRRQGIGRALIEHIEAIARAQGAREMVLMTAWRNTEAHAFYHTLGYRLYTVMMRHPL